jgi:large subunit ribosomal protein L30
MAVKLKITQLRSGIGRPEAQRAVLQGLGLRGPQKAVVLLDTPAIRGMIRKVSHLVRVEPAEG